MLNLFVLVGKVTGHVQRVGNYAEFRIICARPFCDAGGKAGEDQFTIRAWKGIGDEISDLMKDGLLVSVKGRMCMEEGRCILIGEQVTLERML